jgi:hypothetical protein
MTLYKILVAVLLATLLSSCQSTSIRALNDSLSNTYLSMQQATQGKNQMLLQNAQISLANLANEAKTEAQKATDTRNKIVLYRIAATAAWQSGTLDTLAFAKPGQQSCDALSDGDQVAEMATQCAMLAMLPIYAEVDSATATYDQLFARSRQPMNAEQKTDLGTQLKAVVARYNTMIQAALHQRRTLDSTVVSSGFLQQADGHLDSMVCGHIESANNLMGTLIAGAAENRAGIAKLKCELYQVMPNMSCKADIQNGDQCDQ